MSLWLAIFAVAVFVLLAYIVDGGQYMNARERAADIAEQAARAGADQVSVADLRQGTFTIPQAAACQAAGDLVNSYKNGALSASEASTTQMTACPPPENETVTVTVSATAPTFISALTFAVNAVDNSRPSRLTVLKPARLKVTV